MPSANTNRNQIVVSVESNVVKVNVRTTTVNAIAKAQGIKGADGASGTNGVGVPAGGTGGQVLAKIDSTNFNTQWVPAATGSGTVTSVNASGSNGVSVTGGPITTSGSLTIGLGSINPTSVTASGTVTGSNLSGTNTGDQNLTPYALIASPTFTGDPKAPTPTAGDNDTSIATTAFVTGGIATAVSGLATDSLVVHKAGTETITGSKTYSVAPTLSVGGIYTAITPPAYTAGLLFFDNTSDSPTFYNSDSNISLQMGQEEWTRVINKTGSTIANGVPVYVSGSDATSGLPTIAPAQSNSASTTIGLGLTTESIANNAIGMVTTIGVVHGINTSAFTAGLAVYIDPTTAGALTQTAPSAPNYRYRVGIVTVSNATTGAIHVTPSTASLGNGTANQVFGMNVAGTAQEVKSIVGTASQVTITNTANTITASLPSTINVSTSGSAATLTTGRTIGTATGDVTSAGSTFNGSANNTNAYTLATVNANVGSFTKASLTVNAKGLITAASSGTADFITSLTNTGTSGNASVTTGVLNIPNYTYTLPTASTSVLGGVKVDGTTITISSGVISAATGGAGTVSNVSVVSANGFAGTVATSTSTPAITLSTTITGLIKGNGTAISAATSGIDYEMPLTFSTGLTRSTNTITVNTSQNITTLSNLTSNGLIKTSGGTGTLSIATSGTDYQSPISLTTTGSGNATFASNVLNIPNTTYTLPTASTSVLGGVKVDGTSITISSGVISAVSGGSGTVTSVTSATTDASVATTTTTPVITVNSAPATVQTYTQTSHGFSVKQAIYYNGTTWTLSKADSAANASVQGIISSVPTANTFILTQTGAVTTSGLTAGFDYFLDPTTAGAITTTVPTTPGQVYKPIGKALSTTSLLVNIGTGIVISTAGTGTINTGGTGKMAYYSTSGTTVSPTTDLSITGGGSTLSLGIAGGVSNGTLNLAGGTSGTISLITPMVAGTNTVTLPAATDTLVGKATTDTLTNKNLASGTNAFPTFNQNTTGSAATLTTPRTIAIGGTTGLSATGVSFDGSANISPLLTGTLAVANGGTGVTSSTGSGSNVLSTSPTLVTPRFGSAGSITDANGNSLITFPTTVTTPVNQITISNSATLTAPSISATGTDTNIALSLNPKGTGLLITNGVTIATASNNLTMTNKTLTTPVIDQFSTASGLGAAWTSWTPTITAGSGTPTSITVAGATYTQIGKTVHCKANFTVTSIGTAAGKLLWTLPVTASTSAANGAVGAAFEGNLTGTTGTVSLNSATVGRLDKYDGTTPFVANYSWSFTFTYQAA